MESNKAHTLRTYKSINDYPVLKAEIFIGRTRPDYSKMINVFKKHKTTINLNMILCQKGIYMIPVTIFS